MKINNEKTTHLRCVKIKSIQTGIVGTPASITVLTSSVKGRDFSNQTILNANFSGQRLQGANFSNAKLDGANFSNAKLRGAKFIKASLTYNNDNYNLVYTTFENADLTDVDFTRAEFYATPNFNNATLTGAIFKDAIFTDIIDFSNINLEDKLTINVGEWNPSESFEVGKNANLKLSGEKDLLHAIYCNGKWYGKPDFRLGEYEVSCDDDNLNSGTCTIQRGPRLVNTLDLKDNEYIREITVGWTEIAVFYLEFKTNQGSSVVMRPDINTNDENNLFDGASITLKNIKLTNISVGYGNNLGNGYYDFLTNISFTFTKG